MPNAIASFFACRRFRPTLWPTLGLVALVAATISLGNWQRHRAAEKELLREQSERVAQEAPLELPGPMAEVAGLLFRTVRATGEFDERRQILIDNKVQGGRPGYHVVTPLKLGEGRFVLIDRGWIAQRAKRTELPEVPPPAGRVSVEGRINVPPARYLELSADTDGALVRQNLDIERIAAATGLKLMPFVIEQTTDARDGLVRDWPAPDFGIERHQSYMLEWYSLALLGCVLWLTLNWRPEGNNGESSGG